MSLANYDILLTHPISLQKYNNKRVMLLREKKSESFYERVQKDFDADLDGQYKRMFHIDGKIATMKIQGGMTEEGPDWIDIYLGYAGTSYANIRRGVDEAMSAGVKRLDITMNTPGGAIDQLEITTKKIEEAVASGMEVIVYNGGMIASAGVWLSSPATKIYTLGKTSTLGSIGVVVEGFDFTQYYKSLGIESISITNTDSPNKRYDLTADAGKAILRKELDGLADLFFEQEASKRNVSIESIKNLKGEMILSAQAISMGLMDESPNSGLTSKSGTGVKPKTFSKTKNKSKTESKMDEQELKEMQAGIASAVASAVNAAVTPLSEKITGMETTMAADKEKNESIAKNSELFSQLSAQYPEQASLISEEKKAGKDCTVDFSLKVAKADASRIKAAADLASNEDKNPKKVKAKPSGESEASEQKNKLDAINAMG
jgi:ClpP class serine protease